FQAEDGIRVFHVTGVQTCALPIYLPSAARSENASCWAATRSQVAIRSSTLPVPAHVLQTSRRIFVGWTLLTYSTPPYFFTFGTSVAMVRFPAQVGQMVIGQDTFRMNWLGANGLSAGVGCGGRTPS